MECTCVQPIICWNASDRAKCRGVGIRMKTEDLGGGWLFIVKECMGKYFIQLEEEMND